MWERARYVLLTERKGRPLTAPSVSYKEARSHRCWRVRLADADLAAVAGLVQNRLVLRRLKNLLVFLAFFVTLTVIAFVIYRVFSVVGI